MKFLPVCATKNRYLTYCQLMHWCLKTFISLAVIPRISLGLGTNLNADDIEEGDDVYFECKVHANPAAYKVVWKHDVSTIAINLLKLF